MLRIFSGHREFAAARAVYASDGGKSHAQRPSGNLRPDAHSAAKTGRTLRPEGSCVTVELNGRLTIEGGEA